MVSRAAEEAEKSGLSEIRGANRDANMSCYFVRIRVSPMQTDTLLAINARRQIQMPSTCGTYGAASG